MPYGPLKLYTMITLGIIKTNTNIIFNQTFLYFMALHQFSVLMVVILMTTVAMYTQYLWKFTGTKYKRFSKTTQTH